MQQLTKIEDQGFKQAGVLFAKMNGEIAKALPRHLSGEAFARNALTAVRQNKTLLEALAYDSGRASFLGALMQAAQLGLELGPLGHCYLIPYAKKDWKTGELLGYEVTFILGYKGMIELSRRSGNMRSIYANEVCEHDYFELGYGSGGQLVHRPEIRKDRGDWYGVYAFAELAEGGYQYLFINRAEIERLRDTYSQAWKNEVKKPDEHKKNPWHTEPVEMAKKTAIRRLFKSLPVSVEVSRALELEERPLRYDEVTGTVDVEITVDDSPLLDGSVEPEEPPAPPKTESKGEPTLFAEPAARQADYTIHDTPQKVVGSHARRSISAMARHCTLFTDEDQERLRTVLAHMGRDDAESFAEELKATSGEPGLDGAISEREDLLHAFLAKYHKQLPPTATPPTGEDDE